MENQAPHNFMGLTDEFSGYKTSKIVILPVPFDKTTTWLKGSDKGPEAIIDASRNVEFYDIETNSEVCKHGIFTEKAIKAKNSSEMITKTHDKVKNLLKDGKFVVSLGGEHSISIGPIKAYAELYKDMSILHLDAHSDSRDFYEGSKYNHACIMARAREIVKNTVSVGIRSMDSSELKNIDKDKTFYAHDIQKSKDWIQEATNKLSKNVYITIDLDVFDTGIMPSVGTPEPGGLGWYEVVDLLKNVAENKNVIGLDVVELLPSENKAPDFLAAKLIYKLLNYRFSK